MNQPTMPALRAITANLPGRCQLCRAPIAPGQLIWWARGAGSVCDPCHNNPPVPVAPVAPVVDEEAQTRVNELARRYGPVGRFNRQIAQRIVDADPTLTQLGPDALVAELDALCSIYSNYFDVTPGAQHDASSERYYARVNKAIEAVNEELARRKAVAGS